MKNILILLPIVILMTACGDSKVEQEQETTMTKKLSTIKTEAMTLDSSPIDLGEIETFYTCDTWDKTKLQTLLLTNILLPPLNAKNSGVSLFV